MTLTEKDLKELEERLNKIEKHPDIGILVYDKTVVPRVDLQSLIDAYVQLRNDGYTRVTIQGAEQ